jgi:protein-S-isoprenylcysteine O-methyltransferase Ste14
MTPDFRTLAGTPEKLFHLICVFVVMCSTMTVLVAVALDFREFQKRTGVKKEQKSVVETGSMMLFFFLFYLMLRTGRGHVDILTVQLRIAATAIGTLAVVAGCFVNIRGRLNLGKNWSNQIKIYQDHTLVTGGMFGIVRHPLYASLIWMFVGASILYVNFYALLLTLLIFMPFMYYRAKQEEKLLENEFDAYRTYRKKVGMFFPKP